MKSSYIVRATNFLHRIYPRIASYLYTPSCIKTIISNYNRIYGRAIRVDNGATRCVLITSDYVIKWDYSRYVKSYGGCAEEVAMYELAKQEGYEYLFAEATSIIYRGTLFEIMPRFEMKEEKAWITEYISEEEFTWLNTHVKDIHDNNYTVVDDEYIVIVDYACASKSSTT